MAGTRANCATGTSGGAPLDGPRTAEDRGMNRRREDGEEEMRGGRGALSLTRGPNTTGSLGINTCVCYDDCSCHRVLKDSALHTQCHVKNYHNMVTRAAQQAKSNHANPWW
eukprot:636349-Pyramimonas_sp.AAC.1